MGRREGGRRGKEQDQREGKGEEPRGEIDRIRISVPLPTKPQNFNQKDATPVQNPRGFRVKVIKDILGKGPLVNPRHLKPLQKNPVTKKRRKKCP